MAAQHSGLRFLRIEIQFDLRAVGVMQEKLPDTGARLPPEVERNIQLPQVIREIAQACPSLAAARVDGGRAAAFIDL